MSWKTINAILAQAATNETFCQDLLQNPLQTSQTQGFTLSQQEQEIFKQIHASDLAEFCQEILAHIQIDK